MPLTAHARGQHEISEGEEGGDHLQMVMRHHRRSLPCPFLAARLVHFPLLFLPPHSKSLDCSSVQPTVLVRQTGRVRNHDIVIGARAHSI